MKASPTFQRFNQPFFILLVLCSGLFFFRLGVPGLMDPDEGRYAEIAREMLETGDFITPQLNFLPYLEKPPLVYWLTALSMSLGGLNEWAARFIPALSAIGGIMAVYWLAAKLWGPGTGFLAAMVTATSSGYFILGRLLILDMTLTCCLTWGIALSYVAVRNQERRYLLWAYLALGLAVLAKGPVAVVLPALIFLSWFLVQKRWRDIFQLWHFGGALIFAVVVLPWFMLVAWQNPDFWNYFFFQEHIQRFLAPRVHAGEPVYFYFGVLAAGFLPWVFFLPWAWRASTAGGPAPEASQDRLFLLLWFGVIFLFFSLARSKLFPYLLPGLPPLAILVARALTGDQQFDSSSWRWSLRVWFLVASLIFMALMVIAAFFPNLWRQMAIVSPYPTAYSLTLIIPPILLLTGLVSPGNRRYLLVGSALLLNLLVLFGVERVAETRSPRTLAQVINSRWHADSIIVGFQNYFQSISFYTGQPLFLFQTQGELEFGLQQRPENPYFLGLKTQLPELLKQHANFFIIIDQHNLEFFQTLYTEPITILTQWKKYLLITKP